MQPFLPACLRVTNYASEAQDTRARGPRRTSHTCQARGTRSSPMDPDDVEDELDLPALRDELDLLQRRPVTDPEEARVVDEHDVVELRLREDRNQLLAQGARLMAARRP